MNFKLKLRRVSQWLGIAILCLLIPSAAEATRKLFPAGNYYLVAGSDKLGFFEGTLNPIFDASYCDGFRLRIGWSDIQPTDLSTYNWSRLDNAFAVAAAHGKKIGLSVAAGIATPAVVYDSSPTTPRFSIDLADITPQAYQPVPWNAAYKAKWQTFVAALGARYDSNPALSYMVITGFMELNEMYVSKTPGDDALWDAQAVSDGYASKSAAYVPAAEEIGGYFETAFVQTPCILSLTRPWSGSGGPDRDAVNTAMHVAYPRWYGEMVAFERATLPPHGSTPVIFEYPKIGQPLSGTADDTKFYLPPCVGCQPADPQPIDDLLRNMRDEGRTACEVYPGDYATVNVATLTADRLLLIANRALLAPDAPANIVIRK